MIRSCTLAVLLACLVIAGCAHPWQSTAAMARFQKKHYAHLAQLYPPGMSRDELIDLTRGRLRATIALPPDAESQDLYAGTEIGYDLPIMTATVTEQTGVEPALVDVYEFFGGRSGFGVEARYVFYDRERRVVGVLGSPWAD